MTRMNKMINIWTTLRQTRQKKLYLQYTITTVKNTKIRDSNSRITKFRGLLKIGLETKAGENGHL